MAKMDEGLRPIDENVVAKVQSAALGQGIGKDIQSVVVVYNDGRSEMYINDKLYTSCSYVPAGYVAEENVTILGATYFHAVTFKSSAGTYQCWKIDPATGRRVHCK